MWMSNNCNFSLKGWLIHLKIWQKTTWTFLSEIPTWSLKSCRTLPVGSANNRVVWVWQKKGDKIQYLDLLRAWYNYQSEEMQLWWLLEDIVYIYTSGITCYSPLHPSFPLTPDPWRSLIVFTSSNIHPSYKHCRGEVYWSEKQTNVYQIIRAI